MKKTDTNSGNFATAKFKGNSHRLLTVTLVMAIGLSITACPDISTIGEEPIQKEKEKEQEQKQGQNLFLGEWEGNIISSAYESYGEVPVDLAITEEGWFLEVMGQSGEGTYTWEGNVISILYYDEPMGTGTLNGAGELVIEIIDESFGTVTGTLRRKTSEPPAAPAPIDVKVVFENGEDAEIIMEDFILDEDGELAVTVEETFAAYEWYINGVLADNALVSNGGKTITLSGSGNYLNQGNNRLSVKVTTNDGVIYSKIVIFTVG